MRRGEVGGIIFTLQAFHEKHGKLKISDVRCDTFEHNHDI